MKPANNLREIVSGLWFWSAMHEEYKAEFSSAAWKSNDGLILVDPIELDAAGLAKLDLKQARWRSQRQYLEI